MICNFNNFQLLKEDRNTQFNIGDYVIIKYDLSGVYSNISTYPIWHNVYGIIVDSGYFDYIKSKEDNIYLVRVLCDLTDEQKIHFRNQSDNKNIIVRHNTNKEEYDNWFHFSYILKFDTKDEFDKEVEKIELEKAANKYNL